MTYIRPRLLERLRGGEVPTRDALPPACGSASSWTGCGGRWDTASRSPAMPHAAA
jgi:hypothetical protein